MTLSTLDGRMDTKIYQYKHVNYLGSLQQLEPSTTIRHVNSSWIINVQFIVHYHFKEIHMTIGYKMATRKLQLEKSRGVMTSS